MVWVPTLEISILCGLASGMPVNTVIVERQAADTDV